jgi:hypothetical protein
MRNSPINNSRMNQQNYQNENIQYNYNQRNTPQQQYQRNNNYQNSNRQIQNEYNQGRQSPNNYNDMPLRTPQPMYNQSRSPMMNQYDNGNNMLKGSRTPFVDYRTGQNIYNEKRFTPGRNQYNDIPNRPPSRPFGEISFKQQNGGENMGNYRNNYPNTDNYY